MLNCGQRAMATRGLARRWRASNVTDVDAVKHRAPANLLSRAAEVALMSLAER
jgi:hypothetical protein